MRNHITGLENDQVRLCSNNKDQLLAMIFSIRIMRKLELYSTPRMVYEGDEFTDRFNGLINFHNFLLLKTSIKLNLIRVFIILQ